MTVWPILEHAGVPLEVLRQIILIPVGAIVTIIFRNVVGIKTFGTFLPVLIASAFRETGLLAGLLIFVVIILLGAALGTALHRLRILYAPRLTIILVYVVVALFLISIFSSKFARVNLGQAALFPLAVMAITIEGFSLMAKEAGIKKALTLLFHTVVLVIFCYPVINSIFLQTIVLAFPETMLLVIGVSIYLGAWKGLRLNELLRFRRLIFNKYPSGLFMNFEKILGINERNLELVNRYNPAQHYPMADDKLLTKEILEAANISTPKLLHSYRYFYELSRSKEDLWNRSDFVIKPTHGLQGGGIVVFEQFSSGQWFTASGKPYSASDLLDHAADILYGVHALDNADDAVMIEEKVKLDAFFKKITYRGVPDIRVIVFRTHPVMAMLRIPTKRSEGRADLHVGGIGVGIDLKSGLTTAARIKKTPIDAHPDTGVGLCGLQIPHWAAILSIARRVQKHVPLGYMGIDFVLDERHGPQILELNVRPGLEIQNVNNQGLKVFLNSF